MIYDQEPVWEGRSRSRRIGRGQGSIQNSTRPEALKRIKKGKKTGNYDDMGDNNAVKKFQKQVYGPYFIISTVVIDVILMFKFFWF